MRIGLIAALCTFLRFAHAEPPAVRFSLVVDVDSCPDDRAIRAAVVRRLGRDPFADKAARRLTARIAADGDGLRARVELVDAAGRELGRWQVGTPRQDCVELASALVLAISIVLDPPDTPPPSPPVASPPSTSTLSGAVGAMVAAGAAPATTVGLTARMLGGRLGRELGVELRADLPRSEPIQGGRVRTFSLSGALSACARNRGLLLCGVAGAGALHARGEGLTDSRSSTQPMVYAGPRLMAEVPLAGALLLVAHVDGLLSLWQTTLRVDGEIAWATPVFSVVAGLGLGAQFW